jgi:AraC-like DNA-binding protein
MPLLYIASLALTVFFFFLLLGKKRKQQHDRWLLVWLAVISIHIVGFYVSSIHPFHYLLELSSACVFLHGPLLWFYYHSLIKKDYSVHPFQLLHFIPFILHILIIAPSFVLQKLAPLHETTRTILMIAKLLSVVSYMLLLLKAIRVNRKLVKQHFSSMEDKQLDWLFWLLIGFLGISLIGAVSTFAYISWLLNNNEDLLVNLAASVFVSIIGYYGFWQGPIFTHSFIEERVVIQERVIIEERIINSASLPEIKEDKPVSKYEKSRLDEKTANTLAEQLSMYMNSQKPYLEPELTLSSLAKMLHLSTNDLSQIINRVFNKSFFDFVTTYRIEEVKKALQAGAHKNQTLLSISFECGFNSKASFNRAFKATTGYTPTAYIAALALSQKGS